MVWLYEGWMPKGEVRCDFVMACLPKADDDVGQMQEEMEGTEKLQMEDSHGEDSDRHHGYMERFLLQNAMYTPL